MYQMYVFLLLVVRRFGNEMVNFVLSIQIERLARLSPEMSQQLEVAMQHIHETVANHEPKVPFVDREGKQIELPLELALAWRFLSFPEGSPYYASQEDVKAGRI